MGQKRLAKSLVYFHLEDLQGSFPRNQFDSLCGDILIMKYDRAF
jgi:hypothetical protein